MKNQWLKQKKIEIADVKHFNYSSPDYLRLELVDGSFIDLTGDIDEVAKKLTDLLVFHQGGYIRLRDRLQEEWDNG